MRLAGLFHTIHLPAILHTEHRENWRMCFHPDFSSKRNLNVCNNLRCELYIR